MPATSRIFQQLQERKYLKLIIGAALKDFQSIEDYAYYFCHAGADVIDISAFPLSLISAQKGIERALKEDPSLSRPSIMLSVNIGEDPHFRRINLNWDLCTSCELCLPSCPSKAFYLDNQAQFSYEINLCYGCSNCLPYCHYGALGFEQWEASSPKSLLELIDLGAQAFEIHLSQDLEAFKKFYSSLTLRDDILESFSIGSDLFDDKSLCKAAKLVIDCVRAKHGATAPVLLQIDGIPLAGARDLYSLWESGYELATEEHKDLASINKAKLVLDYLHNESLTTEVYLQISGACKPTSLAKALALGVPIHGIAIGSYGRKLILDSSEPLVAARSLGLLGK